LHFAPHYGLLAGMDPLSITILVIAIVAAVGGGLYFLNRWASKRYAGQKEMIDKNKQTVQIYVLEKRHDYAKNVNLPKQVRENLPKVYNYMKMYLVQAKVGPQITTMMTEKAVYNAMPVKKTVKVDVAGIYIVAIKGVKTPEEQKQARKDKLAAEKAAAKAAKAAKGSKN